MCSNLDVCRGTDGERLVQEGVEGRDLVGGDGSGIGTEEAAAEGGAGDRDSDNRSRSHGGGGVGDGDGGVCEGEDVGDSEVSCS